MPAALREPTVDGATRRSARMTLAEPTAARSTQSGAQRRRARPRRPGPERVRPALLAPRLRLPRAKARATWRVVHKLNQCGATRASLYRQGLGEFFLDDLWQYEAAVVVLAPAGAGAPAARCSPTTSRRADSTRRAYSMVAYPWSPRYQQSNQWAIETLALAPGPGGRARASAPRRGCACRATSRRRCTLRRFKRLGARLIAANIAFDDHPTEKRFSDRIETVTVDSVFALAERTGLGGHPGHHGRLRAARNARTRRLLDPPSVPRRWRTGAATRIRTSSRCSASAASRRSSGPSSSAPATTTCSSSRSP